MVRWAQYAAEKGSGSFLEGGRRGRAAPTTQGRGPRPPPLRWFCGPSGPAKRRRPPGDPPGRPVGGGGVHGPGPLALAPEQARCRAQPGSGRVGVAHPPPPPRPLEFPPTPKRQRKSQAPRSMGPGCLNDPRKGQGNGPAPLGKARAHALRARAASSALPRAIAASRPQPLLRAYRRARSTA